MLSSMNVSRGKIAFEQWSQDLESVCGRFITKPKDGFGDFYGSVSLKRMAGLEFADISTNASSVIKTNEEASVTGGDNVFLIFQQSGSSLFSQQGKSSLLNAGESILIDSRRGCEIRHLDDIRHLSFHLPIGLLERRLGSSKLNNCEAFTATDPVGNVLNNFIRQVFTGHVVFNQNEAAVMEDVFLTILSPLANDSDTEGGNFQISSKILNIIDSHLSEELTPEYIARTAGVSTRSLYRLFERGDQSLNTYIREKRLLRCVEQFHAKEYNLESITKIAYRWGFKDSAHFSRSFRNRYGMTPRAYRNEL